MNDRRNFLRGAGLLGTLVAGVYTGMTVASNTAPTVVPEVKEAELDISHLAPADTNNTNLMLTANNNPPKPPPKYATSSPYVIAGSTISQPTLTVGIGNAAVMSSSEDMNKLKMTVGKDNRLWIDVDGKWKRVVLEG
jgi:hypothetical protein